MGTEFLFEIVEDHLHCTFKGHHGNLFLNVSIFTCEMGLDHLSIETYSFTSRLAHTTHI